MYPTSGHEFFPCETDPCPTVGDWYNLLDDTLQPILEKYGVDIYAAGHIHDYESTWPILGSKTPVQKDYNDPKGVVYITGGLWVDISNILRAHHVSHRARVALCRG